MLVFGPQGRISSEDLTELRSRLTSEEWLSKLYAAAQGLHNFWFNLVRFDSDLAQVAGESCLRDFAEWLSHARPFPCQPSEMPATLAFPINFLFQLCHYGALLRLMNEDNRQRAVLERLGDGGVQGFCVGFLSAITVASSWSEEELIETAVRALRLAVCIGAYVDKDAFNTEPACISVRGRQTETRSEERVAEVLQNFPKVCMVTHSSMTIKSQ